MSDMPDIDRFVKDPSMLVELCRQVIEQHGVTIVESDAREREIQLLEISKAIDRLDKMGISVPGALRAEKLRLACSSEISEDAAAALEPMVSGLWNLLGKIRSRLQKLDPDSTNTHYQLPANGIKRHPPSKSHLISNESQPPESSAGATVHRLARRLGAARSKS